MIIFAVATRAEKSIGSWIRTGFKSGVVIILSNLVCVACLEILEMLSMYVYFVCCYLRPMYK